jgi:hypothetical protein
MNSDSDALIKLVPSHFQIPAYMDRNMKINEVIHILTKFQDQEDHRILITTEEIQDLEGYKKIKDLIFKLSKIRKQLN